MTENKWIALEKTERYRDHETTTNNAKRRAQLLRNRLIETQIADKRASTKQREQKLADERERIRAEAIAEVDHEQNDRIAEIHERAHNWIARFFIVGCAIVFGFCGLWIAAFGIMILIGILSALLGFAT